MLKTKNKLFITLFIMMILFLLSFTSFSFATDSTDVMPISNNEEINTNSNSLHSDLYISDKEQYDINNTIEGNVFASLDTLNINSKDNSVITGNVYATAKNVNIKSNVTYSNTEKDEVGNPKIDSINDISVIYGNVFVTASKFVLEPGSEIDGDLYICANEVELAQNSVIYGNVFVVANKVIINSQIGGDLYATARNFDMKYYGFVRRDLHLSAQNSNLSGYVYRNSFITSDTITTTDKFMNEYDFNIENASSLTFSGEVKGNANINSKKIDFKNKDNDKSITCKIGKDLNYSSNDELTIVEGIVSGNTNYSKYVSNTKTLSATILEYVLGILTSLVYILVIYLIINKFSPQYIDKISSLSISNILVALAIGLGLLILIPIISLLLFITRIGSLLGFLLLVLYILVLMIAKPIFVISISILIKDKFSNNSIGNNSSVLSNIISILILTIILSLISLIPYVGFIVSLSVILTGFGIFAKSLLK